MDLRNGVRGVGEDCEEVIYLRQVQKFIKPSMESYSVTISEDNQGTIGLANNPIGSKRTKHIDIKHHFIRDMVKEQINIVYVNTADQHTDVLTKPLDRKAFEGHIGGALVGFDLFFRLECLAFFWGF